MECSHLWPQCVTRPSDRNFFVLTPLSLCCAADTPFEDGTFKLLLTFDESYPNKPPTVKFLSRMHDPNPNSPANAEAAQLYRENMKEYVRRVRATVEDSWLEDDEKAVVGEAEAQ